MSLIKTLIFKNETRSAGEGRLILCIFSGMYSTKSYTRLHIRTVLPSQSIFCYNGDVLSGNEVTYDEVLSGNNNPKHSSEVPPPKHGLISGFYNDKDHPTMKKATGPRA